MDEDESGAVDREEFRAWWLAQPAEGGQSSFFDVGQVKARLRLKRAALSLADALGAMLTLNYGFTVLPGSGARRCACATEPVPLPPASTRTRHATRHNATRHTPHTTYLAMATA